MDFLRGENKDQSNMKADANTGGGFMGSINNAMGGGQQGEKNEDSLDKGVDYVQEHVLGQGQQSNESAVEQAKDEQISDAVRRGYKGTMRKDFPVADK